MRKKDGTKMRKGMEIQRKTSASYRRVTAQVGHEMASLALKVFDAGS
jgi:hypothetical protein